MFKIPFSVKAVTAAVTAVVVNWAQNALHVPFSDSVKGLIAGAIGLGLAAAVKEGVPYVNAWLKRYTNGEIEVDPEP